ncbi:hypothetical protein GWK47_007805 [Chionoecetes opilio]|uniref:Uncharacterized protein n=1 Tax=Chionoecetes opilio TaxID=41210 RepID=A0A8J4YBD3_CHIOP|nr:hypothetical protein GWK47_007805 [Chionoecetes opilio]
MTVCEDHLPDGDADNLRVAENGQLHEEPSEESYLIFETSETSLLQYSSSTGGPETQYQDAPMIKAYKSRFWIVSLASVLCWLHCCAHSHLPVIFLLILKTSTSSTAATSWAMVMEGVVSAIVIKMRQRSDDGTKLFTRHEGWRLTRTSA